MGIMLRSKSNNNERKSSTHYFKSIIAEKIVSVITQVCKETKLWIHPTYGGQIPHLLILLNSLTFVL